MGGLAASRSGLFWEWLRVLDEMTIKPTVIALENVVGLLSANGGQDFRLLHDALRERSYKAGAMVLDARYWVPQSRPRVFVVAVLDHCQTTDLEDHGPNWLHPEVVRKAMGPIKDTTWWAMPRPATRPRTLAEIIDWDAPVFDRARRDALFSLIAPRHQELLHKLPATSRSVFPGYRRTRNGKQVLELRFDNTSGCLRTAEGGSSRQFLLLHDRGNWEARLITTREAARLMGAPEKYRLSPSYNEAYNAMGDAVVVPVVKHLVDHLLVPLVQSRTAHARRTSTSPSRIRLIA